MKYRNDSDFFCLGGNVPLDSPSYIKRDADTLLPSLAASGELCFIFDTRQKGKSSLMERAKKELQERWDIPSVNIELTLIGEADEEVWYFSLLEQIHESLSFEEDLEDWWESNQGITYISRLQKYFREVVLKNIQSHVVVFLDEVDSILSLHFSDDFFAALRAIYNQRNTIFGRISFVLIGAVAPYQLIKDHTRTPLNVGSKIPLKDFSYAEMKTLLPGLPNQDETILSRIYYWTDGHPYWTQKLGFLVAKENEENWTEDKIDRLVYKSFLTEAGAENDDNLPFVRDRILLNSDKNELLNLYQKIHRKKYIKNDEQDRLQAELKLSGIVKVDEHGKLRVRNKIYRRVFNQKWIKNQLPKDEARFRALLYLGIALVSLISLLLVLFLRPQPEAIQAETFISNFQNSSNPTLRLSNLANLFELPDYKEEALGLFNNLTLEEQIAIFDSVTLDLQPQAQIVVQGTYSFQYADDLATLPHNTDLLQAMQTALEQSSDVESILSNEIKHWVEGRIHMVAGEYGEARLTYSVSIGLNANNPGTHLERSLAHVGLGDYPAAADDLMTAVTLDPSLQSTVNRLVEGNPTLLAAIWQDEDIYGQLIAFVPTPTYTITPSPTVTTTPTPTNTPTTTSTNTPTPTETSPPTNTPTPTETSTPTSTPTPTDTPIPPPPPPDQLVIDSPKDGAGVSGKITVSGMVPPEDLQSGQFLNIIVIAPSVSPDEEYWVQGWPSVDANGKWSSSVFIGREGSAGQEDIGKTFQICAVIRDDQLDKGHINFDPTVGQSQTFCISVTRTS